MIILKQILKKQDVKVWTAFSCLRVGSIGGYCRLSRILLDQLNNCQLLKEDSAAWSYSKEYLCECLHSLSHVMELGLRTMALPIALAVE
jgi:hypothetical protein